MNLAEYIQGRYYMTCKKDDTYVEYIFTESKCNCFKEEQSLVKPDLEKQEHVSITTFEQAQLNHTRLSEDNYHYRTLITVENNFEIEKEKLRLASEQQDNNYLSITLDNSLSAYKIKAICSLIGFISFLTFMLLMNIL